MIDLNLPFSSQTIMPAILWIVSKSKRENYTEEN